MAVFAVVVAVAWVVVVAVAVAPMCCTWVISAPQLNIMCSLFALCVVSLSFLLCPWQPRHRSCIQCLGLVSSAPLGLRLLKSMGWTKPRGCESPAVTPMCSPSAHTGVFTNCYSTTAPDGVCYPCCWCWCCDHCMRALTPHPTRVCLCFWFVLLDCVAFRRALCVTHVTRGCPSHASRRPAGCGVTTLP